MVEIYTSELQGKMFSSDKLSFMFMALKAVHTGIQPTKEKRFKTGES